MSIITNIIKQYNILKNKSSQRKIDKAYKIEIQKYKDYWKYLYQNYQAYEIHYYCAKKSELILHLAQYAQNINIDDVSLYADGMTLEQRERLVEIAKNRNIPLTKLALSNIDPHLNPVERNLPKPFPLKIEADNTVSVIR